jgi:hypothetical protein
MLVLAMTVAIAPAACESAGRHLAAADDSSDEFPHFIGWRKVFTVYREGDGGGFMDPQGSCLLVTPRFGATSRDIRMWPTTSERRGDPGLGRMMMRSLKALIGGDRCVLMDYTPS